MVEMGGIEPPSNKPLLSRSFRKPKFAHNNAENFSTNVAWQIKSQWLRRRRSVFLLRAKYTFELLIPQQSWIHRQLKQRDLIW